MRTEHLPECEKAWGYADAMSGRGIETADCWLCELLDRTRAEALREAREAIATSAFFLQGHREYALAVIDALGGQS